MLIRAQFRQVEAWQHGFGLLEALIATLLVSFGMLGLAKLQAGYLTGSGESRTHLAALHYAEAQLENLRHFATQSEFDTLLTSGDFSDDDPCDPEALASLCAGINAKLNRSWTISDCTPSTLPCKTIEVTVAWRDAEGKDVSVRLKSIMTRTEPVDSGVAIAASP